VSLPRCQAQQFGIAEALYWKACQAPKLYGECFGFAVINGMAEGVQMVAEGPFAAFVTKAHFTAGADLLWRIRLIGVGIDGQALEVQACFAGKDSLTNDRMVSGDGDICGLADGLAERGQAADLIVLHPSLQTEKGDSLFQAAVACPFAKAEDGGIDPGCSGLKGSYGICRGHAEIIMGVDPAGKP